MGNSPDEARGVYLIYTGGTIGSMPQDEKDPLSPLVSKDLGSVLSSLPTYKKLDERIAIGDKWIYLGIHSWDDPIDSSDVGPEHWKQIAKKIYEKYEYYNGFVVLHGTDTMAYTASALSFMLDNLQKPVIVTGSQKPIGEARSDAVQNLVTAIEIAAAKDFGLEPIPEVAVFFRDKLYRGCRTTKMSASSYSGFDSPNCLPLATAGEHIEINSHILRKSKSTQLHVNAELEENIASLDIYPGMDPILLDNILSTKGLKGVVLKTFGTGNAPTNKDFLNAIKKALSGEDKKVIVDVTQCKSGEVELGLYEVSAGLLSRGVISGMDMTAEAALTKLAVVLGHLKEKGNYTLAQATDEMQINLKGEQKQSIFNLHFGSGSIARDHIDTINQLGSMHKLGWFDKSKIEKGILRFLNVQMDDEGESKGDVEIKVYINEPSANENTSEEGNPHFIGKTRKRWNIEDGGANIFFDVTDQVKKYVEEDDGHEISLTIVNMSRAPFKWDKLNLAIFTD